MVLRIDHISGFAYTAQSLVLASYADQALREQHSPVAVYENLQPLGPGHSTAEQVANVGRGHFNHAAGPPDRPPSWRFITFSSSDNR